jgi:beta-glucosidase/6-phospho-beta-glucosidase/beta-galactosidase
MATDAGPAGPAGFPTFAWSVGEEGSDPVVLSEGRRFRHDQLAQSGHYDRMEADLADVAELGVRVVRYGMPWRRTEPESGRYDWSLWDTALRACEQAGLEPVVDLLHFGLPDHAGPFAATGWIEAFGRYVDAFLARYGGVRWFTPVNEPGITALFTARFGLWNDRLTAPEDHARVLAHVVLANLEALQRIHADRDAAWVGSEGFTAPVAVTPEAAGEAAARRALDWLVWDLHLGREPLPDVAGYLDPVPDSLRSRIRDLAVPPDRLVAGLDVYPICVQAVGGPTPAWSTSERVELAVAELARWHDRYELPFWVAETSNLSLSLDERVPWLDALAAGLRRLQSEGRPARGLCWYSRGDQYDWQTALVEPRGAVTEVGLFDTERRPRPVAQRFAELAAPA